MMLSDVCLSVAYIGPKSGTQRPRKTEIARDVAHVTRDSDIISRSKGRFAHRRVGASCGAAAVGVGTCWPWETAATLPSARRRKALRRPRGEDGAGGIPWRPPARLQLVYITVKVIPFRKAAFSPSLKQNPI